MIKWKMAFMFIISILIAILILFFGMVLIVSIHGISDVNAGYTMAWFPTDDEIVGEFMFWAFLAGGSVVFELILIFLEIKFIKKLRWLINSNSLNNRNR